MNWFEREKEPDAFGRFLTTSMLPRLAELWHEKRIIYFVATNHINYFDSAVTRGQRFDSVILVSPPAFKRKVKELRSLLKARGPLKNVRFRVIRSAVETALASVPNTPGNPDARLDRSETLAAFMLLRWDELEELAFHLSEMIKPVKGNAIIDRPALEGALVKMADARLRLCEPYSKYNREAGYQRRDWGKSEVWLVKGLSQKPAGVKGFSESPDGQLWLITKGEPPESHVLPQYQISRRGPGILKFTPAT